MENTIKKMEEAVRGKLGDHCIGVVDRAYEDDQFAFVTDEVDKGEHVPGYWVDVIQKTVWDLGIEHAPVMPFPVHGKLIYVVAGLRKYACNRDGKNGES